jgi:ATP-dependent Lon protease
VIVPKENRKDLREVPRRVLKSTRVVLVDHMDDVLREALCLPAPEALFGPPRERWEYREGELVVLPGGPAPDIASGTVADVSANPVPPEPAAPPPPA